MSSKALNKYLIPAVLFVASVFPPFISLSGIDYSIWSLIFAANILTKICIITLVGLLIFIAFFYCKNMYNPFRAMLVFLTLIYTYLLKSFIQSIESSSNFNISSGYIFIIGYLIILVIIDLPRYLEKNALKLNDIVEIGLFVSIGIILDLPFLKIPVVSNGGSISFIMLPLIFVSIRKGFYKGFLASGIVFGLVSCLYDGYGIITYPFDYLLGFGSAAICGLFRDLILFSKKRVISLMSFLFAFILCFSFRTLASSISGIIFYGLNFIESFIYNISYLLPSLLGCLALGLVLLPSLVHITKKYR